MVNQARARPQPFSGKVCTRRTIVEFETLKVDVEGSLGQLILNRPERLNALSSKALLELREAAQWFDARPEVRVVILRGEGRAFSAGADLKDSAIGPTSAGAGNDWLARREAGQYGLRMADAIEQMRAVTIAQIHGYAIGGGVVLAAICDLRLASEDAVFQIPEVDLGVPLAWGGIPRLVREIGPALTKELVMTCRRFGAREAQAAGFLNRVVPAERLAAEARALAEELLRKPPVPVAITKEHVNSVARAQGLGFTAFADGDALLAVSRDAESRAAAEVYRRRTIARS
jgi:enoyl-CoA hydratase/carnithine racemase